MTMKRFIDLTGRRFHAFDRPGGPGLLQLRALTISAALAVSLVSLAPTETQAAGGDLQSFVTKKAATLENLHRKAKRALVNAAQDRAFEGYFHAHDDAARHTAKQRIEQVSLATQRRFSVEEMCLIDPTGTELTRIVGDEIAPDSDLSTEEAQAAFFKPGFAEAPRRVYVSNPYMSPDAHKWVLAYVTPVMADGEKKAILHYEHGLEVYQAAVNKGLNGDGRYLLVVSRGGFVISDSRKSPAIAKSGDAEDPADYFQHLDDVSPKSLVKVYESVGGNKTGTAKISDGGVDFDVAYAVVEGGLVVLGIERL
jgi:hypothetical protein